MLRYGAEPLEWIVDSNRPMPASSMTVWVVDEPSE